MAEKTMKTNLIHETNRWQMKLGPSVRLFNL